MAVSIIALVLSVLSLGWQAWTWLRAGPVVSVAVAQSLPVYRNSAGEWHTTVTATNKGRSAVTVSSWGFALPNGRTLYTANPAPWSEKLPHRLEPQSSANWHVDTDEIKQACSEHAVRYQDLRAWVSLGNGTKSHSRKTGIGLK